MPILLWIILSTFAISLIAWVGVLVLFFKEAVINKITLALVAFSAGALLAGALLHLIPETIEKSNANYNYFIIILLGFTVFLAMEQFIHWHHCHSAPCEHKQPMTYLILIANGVHNFIDGLAIGAAFFVDLKLGLITWFAVAAHEVPQKLGEFGILLNGGWEKKRALLFNFYTALTVLVGGLAAYFFAREINIVWLLAFAAGSFIYIACSDLIPEIKHHEKMTQNIIHFLSFLFGILIIWAVKFLD
jgi:zinc and cadmium transporter